ncbi:DUF453 domain protein [Penicillium angulare]|uniref:DUF453 domain protein n=1 Tax=Penicillium angulare TaxID=116970 RepID=A0A9W9FCN7_9EURO|nr:DUF453 domain protein [Penicillium angulare]
MNFTTYLKASTRSPPISSFVRQCSRPLSTTAARLNANVRPQKSLAAAYYRGGTSRAIMFKRDDLPLDQGQWNPILLGCIGSPDPYGRQLDGMGGGISSLSKVCVVGPSEHPDADVDYTFVSLGVENTHVDFSSNCGNMSAAVGPFAIDSGMMSSKAEGHENGSSVTVRVLNTNTQKVIHVKFPVIEGEAQADGDFSIDGVAGTAAPVELRFIDPAGSRTGKLFPTGSRMDMIDSCPVTCIDAGNPCCFVESANLGVSGTLTPEEIDNHPTLKRQLESIRRKAGVKMGLASTENEVPGSIPKIGFVSKPDTEAIRVGNVVVRAMSVGQPHKAVPVTVAVALAAAANTNGTVVSQCVVKESATKSETTVIHASGTLAMDAQFDFEGHLKFATVFRTARRLMEGKVFWKDT